MTWLWIVLSFLVFIFSVYTLSKRYHYSFKRFFNTLPLLISLIYIMGSYSFLIFEHNTFLPWWETIAQIISPYGYNFHYIGLVSWFIVYLILFLKWVKNPTQRRKRIDIFFYSTAFSVIPLGIFLLLGDDFIGITTQSWIGIQAFTDNSKLSKYSKVMPVGLFLSITWVISVVSTRIIKRYYKKAGIGYLGFAIMFFLVSMVFLFQQYPKHGVAQFFWLTVDIKHYYSRLITIICVYAYMYAGKRNQQFTH